MTRLLHEEAMAARMLLSALREHAPGLSDEDAELAVSSETSLDEALEAAIQANAVDAAHVMAIKQVIADLEARAARKAARIERRKGAMLAAMEIAGLSKRELATATLSVGKGRRAVVITDSSLIPAEYIRETITRSPDKETIGVALANKRQVPGAELSNAMPTLRITTR